MKRVYLISLITIFFSINSFSQGKFILPDSDKDRISFKLINNLIVIPVEVNGVELSFILDTGVSKPIIFNFVNLTEELKINQTERIYLRGLGEGESVEALKSRNNVLKIGDAISIGQDIYALFDPSLNFAPQLGVPIHGIIGSDFFRDFVVEINYANKKIVFHSPNSYELKVCKKCRIFDLDFFNRKPYIVVQVEIDNNKIPVKLLIDSGGSDALWLFDDEEKGINVPDRFFQDFLGRGLSGNVNGKRSKITGISFQDFTLKDVNVAFPDSISISYARKYKERNGSLGGEILKRFNVIFDYQHKRLILKKNKYFNDEFYYNKSGVTLEHNGVRVIKRLQGGIVKSYGNIDKSTINSGGTKIILDGDSYAFSLVPAFIIVELRADSAAERSGLQIGDIILSVNYKSVYEYSLQEVTQLFYGEDGKRIKVIVDRAGVQMKFQFKLESLL